MIPPNGFKNPDRVVKTYTFGGGLELQIIQETSDFGQTLCEARKTERDKTVLYLTIFGRWSKDSNCIGFFDSENSLVSLLKKA